MKTTLYSNEIVFRGHPDKVCDQISGALLKEYIKGDKTTRAGIEVCGGKGKIFITGEVTSKTEVDVETVTRRVLADVGYDADRYEIINNLGIQSADIALGVDKEGAGDQGMMFGYACNDTEEFLPTAMVILQKFSKRYDRIAHSMPNFFLPDGKAQITGVYDEHGNLLKIKTFLVSYQNPEHHRDITDEALRDIIKEIIKPYNLEVEEYLFNPTGKFEIGGFDGDAGLTGRKIVVDAYQSFANVGGGCMNGKDPTKVDFSAAHKARQIAKRIVWEEGYRWCEVQISYAIGLAKPLAIYAKTDKGDYQVPESVYDECKPKQIIADLGLLNLDYEQLAKFGHFVDQKAHNILKKTYSLGLFFLLF